MKNYCVSIYRHSLEYAKILRFGVRWFFGCIFVFKKNFSLLIFIGYLMQVKFGLEDRKDGLPSSQIIFLT